MTEKARKEGRVVWSGRSQSTFSMFDLNIVDSVSCKYSADLQSRGHSSEDDAVCQSHVHIGYLLSCRRTIRIFPQEIK